ncbi:hypothetical protein [Mycobacterium sp. UM_CSW]|nr:hypothetical protein [Mycobacterium sp. UM_CSW]
MAIRDRQGPAAALPEFVANTEADPSMATPGSVGLPAATTIWPC